MPLYGSAATSTSQQGGKSVVWDNETPTLGSSSLSVILPNSDLPKFFSVEVDFSGDPGNYQIDIESTDTDSDRFYIARVSMSGNLNAGFVARAEVFNVAARYVRLNLVQLQNPVTLTASISR